MKAETSLEVFYFTCNVTIA